MDYYRVLGVPRNADNSEIEAAFQKWKGIYNPATHPDPPKATLYAKEIEEAYRVLVNPSCRKEHDRSVDVAGRLMQFNMGIYWEYRPKFGRYVRCDDQGRAAEDYGLEMQRVWSAAEKEYDQRFESKKKLDKAGRPDPDGTVSGGVLSTGQVSIETPTYFKKGVYWRDEECSFPFYNQDAAAVLWEEKTEQKKAEERRLTELARASAYKELASGVTVVTCLLVLGATIFGGIALWQWLDDSGYIYHDEMTIVYSPDWQFGEYKTCTTLNGAPQNILCDGGVPSDRIEDGKIFKVRFWGRTYDEEKPAVGGAPDVAPTVLYWNCRKNEGSDPSITCELPRKEK